MDEELWKPSARPQHEIKKILTPNEIGRKAKMVLTGVGGQRAGAVLLLPLP